MTPQGIQIQYRIQFNGRRRVGLTSLQCTATPDPADRNAGWVVATSVIQAAIAGHFTPRSDRSQPIERFLGILVIISIIGNGLMQPRQSRTQFFAQSVGRLYRGELQTVLNQLETQRLAIRQRGLIAAVCIGGAFILLFLLMSLIRLGGGMVLGILAILSAIAWYAWLAGLINQYRNDFKQQVIQRLVKLYDENLSYNPTGGISQQEFCNSLIYQHSIDRYSNEDLIYGLLGKTAVRFSEVHAEYKTTTTDSKGNCHTQWHTIFKGIFFVADFNKYFKGRTIIQPDHLESAWGGLGCWLQSLKAKAQVSSDQGQLVKLEDPNFERLFAVYSTDQVEARYILSTSLMQRLIEFHDRVGKPVAISFVDSKVHIAIPNNKNLFEPPSIWFGSALMTQQEVQTYFDDIKLAAAIVEDLNLNLRIWTRK